MEKNFRCPVEKEFERKSAQEILQQMDGCRHSLEISCWGARAFASIAGSAYVNQDTHSLAEFLDDGGCEALVSILNKYADCSEIVASYGCLAIGILAWSMRELKEFLGEIGACEAVVFATSMHIGHPDVSEFGSRAILALAKQNISNSYKLSMAGGCEVVLQVGNFGFNIRDERCLTVATNTCLAIAYLSEAINAAILHDQGAASLIIELLRLHGRDEELCVGAVKAICALGSLSALLREDLGRAGVCKLLIDTMQRYSNLNMRLEACEATMHLTLNPNNADRFASLGGCELLLSPLVAPLFDMDFGPEILIGSLLNFCVYGLSAIENRQKLIREGVRKVLKVCQFNVKASYKARESIQQIFELIGKGEEEEGEKGSRENLLVIHGSEMKGETVPLQVEWREEVIDGEREREYESFSALQDELKEEYTNLRGFAPSPLPFSSHTPHTTPPTKAQAGVGGNVKLAKSKEELGNRGKGSSTPLFFESTEGPGEGSSRERGGSAYSHNNVVYEL